MNEMHEWKLATRHPCRQMTAVSYNEISKDKMKINKRFIIIFNIIFLKCVFCLFWKIRKNFMFFCSSCVTLSHKFKMAPMPSIKSPTKSTENSFAAYATSQHEDSTDSGSISSTPPLSSSSSNGVGSGGGVVGEVPSVLVVPPKSQCSSLSDGESYEGYGENDVNMRDACATAISLNHSSVSDGNNNLNGSAGGVELELAPHGNSTLNT